MTVADVDRPELARVGRVPAMVAHQEQLPVGDDPRVDVAERLGRLRLAVVLLEDIRLDELRAVDEDRAVVDLDRVATDADDPLDVRLAARTATQFVGGLKTTMSPCL